MFIPIVYWNRTLRYCGGSYYVSAKNPHSDYDDIKGDGLWLTHSDIEYLYITKYII